MDSISVSYTPKYEIDFAPNYIWTECNKCFNIKTGRRIKQVYNNGSIGYSINGKFMSLTRLSKHLVKITEVECSF